MTVWLGFLALLLLATPARADVGLPPGFTSEVYVTGQGFDTSGERGVSGIPSVGTLGLDAAGTPTCRGPGPASVWVTSRISRRSTGFPPVAPG